MSGSLLDLAELGAAPLVAVGDRVISRGDIDVSAGELSQALRARNVRRVLVRSDNPAVLLRCLDGCSRAGADLFVAHTYLADSIVHEIVEAQAIGLRVESEETWAPSPAAAESSGRVFMMTSGTTGAPKIAAHTLTSLLGRVRATAALPANRSGRWLLTFQPTGFAGVQVMLTAALAHGLIVAPEHRMPHGFYEAARRWDVQQISATPTFWRAFLMVADPDALSLRQVTLGGEGADQATLDRLKKAFPRARLTHTYASTEGGVVYAVHDGLEGFPAAWLERPNQGAQLRIRDGFLQIQSQHAMSGYLGQSAQPLLEDGWLATADRAEIIGDRVLIRGRDDATINVGGSKVYPAVVESFLLALDGVAEARVYGAPNPVTGFLVGAEIVAASGVQPDDLRKSVLAACRAGLPNYQAPRVLRVVDAIQTKASGKKG